MKSILEYAIHYRSRVSSPNTTLYRISPDLIAIPDFGAGAMENWGLITYREVAILYEEGKSSRSDKEYVAIVVAHELAHQVA